MLFLFYFRNLCLPQGPDDIPLCFLLKALLFSFFILIFDVYWRHLWFPPSFAFFMWSMRKSHWLYLQICPEYIQAWLLLFTSQTTIQVQVIVKSPWLLSALPPLPLVTYIPHRSRDLLLYNVSQVMSHFCSSLYKGFTSFRVNVMSSQRPHVLPLFPITIMFQVVLKHSSPR